MQVLWVRCSVQSQPEGLFEKFVLNPQKSRDICSEDTVKHHRYTIAVLHVTPPNHFEKSSEVTNIEHSEPMQVKAPVDIETARKLCIYSAVYSERYECTMLCI